MSSPFINTINYPGLYHYPLSRFPPFFPPSDTEDSSGGKFYSGSSSGHGDSDGGDGDFDPIKMDFYPSDSYSCGGDSDFYRINGDFYGDISGKFDESPASVFGGTDKQTMQDLNGRLAKYLEKVHSLRESNTELERKIHEWYENKEGLTATFTQKGYSNYCTTIGELRAKIFQCTTDNFKVILEVDNARLTAEDFKLKYENELGMRRSVAADISGLRRVLDQLTVSKSDLEIQVESLNEELAYHKKNHEEKARLEASLSESECNYGAQLFQIQSTISRQEAQLTDIRSDMARQNHEYKTLLYVKNCLQMEINKYQQLIEGKDAK